MEAVVLAPAISGSNSTSGEICDQKEICFGIKKAIFRWRAKWVPPPPC